MLSGLKGPQMHPLRLDNFLFITLGFSKPSRNKFWASKNQGEWSSRILYCLGALFHSMVWKEYSQGLFEIYGSINVVASSMVQWAKTK